MNRALRTSNVCANDVDACGSQSWSSNLHTVAPTTTVEEETKQWEGEGRRWSGHLVGTITYSNPIRRCDAMFCLRGGVGGRHECRGENRYDYLRGVALSSELAGKSHDGAVNGESQSATIWFDNVSFFFFVLFVGIELCEDFACRVYKLTTDRPDGRSAFGMYFIVPLLYCIGGGRWSKSWSVIQFSLSNRTLSCVVTGSLYIRLFLVMVVNLEKSSFYDGM